MIQNPLLWTVPLIAAAYMGAADAEAPPLPDVPVPDVIPPVHKEVEQAQVDPMTGNVWDRRAGEWVTLVEYRTRIRAGLTDRTVEQVPAAPHAIDDGFRVLAERQEAVRRHWDHVLWLRDRGLIR